MNKCKYLWELCGHYQYFCTSVSKAAIQLCVHKKLVRLEALEDAKDIHLGWTEMVQGSWKTSEAVDPDKKGYHRTAQNMLHPCI